MEKMFMEASRGKFRFNFKGLVSVEDLWDLRLEELDVIYRDLNSSLKKVEEESLMKVKSDKDKVLATKIELVKFIYEVKSKEIEDRENAKIKADKRNKINEILAKKQADSLENMSEEELIALRDNL